MTNCLARHRDSGRGAGRARKHLHAARVALVRRAIFLVAGLIGRHAVVADDLPAYVEEQRIRRQVTRPFGS